MSDPEKPGITFERVERDAYAFVFQTSGLPPEIPDGMGRVCNQCGKIAWAQSRWCWHCRYDFDRAALRWHPAKLLTLSLIANVALCALCAMLLLTSHKA